MISYSFDSQTIRYPWVQLPSIPPIDLENQKKILIFNIIQDFFFLPTLAKNPIKMQSKKLIRGTLEISPHFLDSYSLYFSFLHT